MRFRYPGDKEVFVFGLESEQVWVEEISLVKIFLDGEQRESVKVVYLNLGPEVTFSDGLLRNKTPA